MKRNLMPLLGVAFVAAMVATGIFYGLLIPRLRDTATASANASVVVAARAMGRGVVLKAEDVRIKPWTGQALPEGALTLAGDAVGRTLVAAVEAGTVLTRKELASRESGVTAAIPPGMRAVSVHPSESSGVVALLKSGSRVDVQVIDLRGGAGVRRIMEDVEVLSVQGGESSRPVVTLLAPPDQADRLSLADAVEQVRLLARNPDERRMAAAGH